MHNVCVDARNITDRPAGIGRYAIALMERLPTLHPEVRWTAIRHASNREPIDGFEEVFVDAEIGNVIDYTVGAKTIHRAFKRLGTPDLFHSFFHIVPRGIRVPFVTTLHDTIWIDHADTSQPTAFGAFTIRAFASRAIPDTLRRAQEVICVSDATSRRAEQWVSADKLTTISHGVSPLFYDRLEPDAIVDGLRRDDHRYVVAIGNDKPYKNLRRLIDAFLALPFDDVRLALIGGCAGLESHAKSQPGGERVWFLGKLDDTDLRRVLQHADAFVFPSLIEGFGLPILEAMAAGVPTVVSDLEPMRSVAAGSALLCDPRDIIAMRNAIADALSDACRDRLITLGRAHAEKMTWEETARQTVEVYHRVLGAISPG